MKSTKTKKTKNAQVTGVYRHKFSGKWISVINVDGKQIHLGLFKKKSHAIITRFVAELRYGMCHPKSPAFLYMKRKCSVSKKDPKFTVNENEFIHCISYDFMTLGTDECVKRQAYIETEMKKLNIQTRLDYQEHLNKKIDPFVSYPDNSYITSQNLYHCTTCKKGIQHLRQHLRQQINREVNKTIEDLLNPDLQKQKKLTYEQQ